jgi:hypothetical protein
MNKKIYALACSVALASLPLLAFAQINANVPPALPPLTNNLWGVIVGILTFIWPVFIGVGMLMFLIAGFVFLTAQGDPSKIKEARQAMIWGTVGIVVGILSFSMPMIIGNTFRVAP